MKKGQPLEVYERVLAGDVPPEVEVLIISVTQGEACRDMNDVEAVLLERDITGVFIPMRRVGSAIERVIQSVATFVTPKSDPVYKEEATTVSPEPSENAVDDCGSDGTSVKEVE